MKPIRKDRLRKAWSIVSFVGFLVAVVGLLVYAAYAGSPGKWLRALCGVLWPVACSSSVLCAVMALSIQRDQRAERSIEARFEHEFGEMYDAMERNLAYAETYPNWREIHLERHRAALSRTEASRWKSACLFWMLSTGCALAAVVMLYVSGGHA